MGIAAKRRNGNEVPLGMSIELAGRHGADGYDCIEPPARSSRQSATPHVCGV